MRIKKGRNLLGILILLAGSLLLFSGCQLAQQNLETVASDRLCGMLVVDAKIADDWQEKKWKESDGQPIELKPGTLEPIFKELQLEGTAVTDSKKQVIGYDFGEIKGGYFLTVNEEGDDGEIINRMIQSDDAFKVETSMTVMDSGSETVLEGRIPVHMNRIGHYRTFTLYQRPDGSVYGVLGDSFSFSSQETGERMGHTISENFSSEIKGVQPKKESNTSTIKLAIEVVDRLQKAVITEMDEQDQVLRARQVEFDSQEREQNWQIHKDTAYVLVEEHLVDFEGKAYVKHWVYDCHEPEKAGTEKEAPETGISHVFYTDTQEQEGNGEGTAKQGMEIKVVRMNFVR